MYNILYHSSEIKRFMLDEMTLRNTSKFGIFYIGIRKPKVAFSVVHFIDIRERLIFVIFKSMRQNDLCGIRHTIYFFSFTL